MAVREKNPAQTLRLGDKDFMYLSRKTRGFSFSDKVRYLIKVVQAVEGEGLADLVGMFTKNEWKYMANMLQGQEQIYDSREIVRLIIGTNEAAISSPIYGVDLKELGGKLRLLRIHHVLALTMRVQNYWASNEGIDFDVWSNY